MHYAYIYFACSVYIVNLFVYEMAALASLSAFVSYAKGVARVLHDMHVVVNSHAFVMDASTVFAFRIHRVSCDWATLGALSVKFLSAVPCAATTREEHRRSNSFSFLGQ